MLTLILGTLISTSQKINIGSDKVDLKSLISREDKFGEYAWSVISKIIKYSSSLVPGITKDFNELETFCTLGTMLTMMQQSEAKNQTH